MPEAKGFGTYIVPLMKGRSDCPVPICSVF